jgi:hypothetical protein
MCLRNIGEHWRTLANIYQTLLRYITEDSNLHCYYMKYNIDMYSVGEISGYYIIYISHL